MDKPKGLVDVLRNGAKAHAAVRALVATSDPVKNLDIDRVAQGFERIYTDCADIAEPYEAQRLALEKVAQVAFDVLDTRDDRLAATGPLQRLIEAMAAVPPLPEESDGR